MKKLIAAALTAITATPVAAETFHEGDKCVYGQIYEVVREDEGATALFISQDQKQFDQGVVSIYLGNKDWSIKIGDDLGPIKLENESGDWLEYNPIATNSSFFIFAETEHFENVFSGVRSSLKVTRGDKTVVNLSLSGLYSDYMSFKRCQRPKIEKVEEEERRKRVEAANPRDPFAQ